MTPEEAAMLNRNEVYVKELRKLMLQCFFKMYNKPNPELLVVKDMMSAAEGDAIQIMEYLYNFDEEI